MRWIPGSVGVLQRVHMDGALFWHYVGERKDVLAIRGGKIVCSS